MNIAIKNDYKLSDGEKYYIINLLLSAYCVRREKKTFIRLASMIKSTGSDSINELIKITSKFASKISKFEESQILPAVEPSIEYFFNNVQVEIRKRSCNIDIFN